MDTQNAQRCPSHCGNDVSPAPLCQHSRWVRAAVAALKSSCVFPCLSEKELERFFSCKKQTERLIGDLGSMIECRQPAGQKPPHQHTASPSQFLSLLPSSWLYCGLACLHCKAERKQQHIYPNSRGIVVLSLRKLVERWFRNHLACCTNLWSFLSLLFILFVFPTILRWYRNTVIPWNRKAQVFFLSSYSSLFFHLRRGTVASHGTFWSMWLENPLTWEKWVAQRRASEKMERPSDGSSVLHMYAQWTPAVIWKCAPFKADDIRPALNSESYA